MILNSLDILDIILEQLRDINWHSLDEVKKSISLPKDKLKEVLCFLQKQAFIDKKDGKLRITCMGLRFSRL